MCGRFALNQSPAELVRVFGLLECAGFGPRFNIAPGTDIPAVRRSPEGNRLLHLLRWGLVPHWARDVAIGARLNNARGESVTQKPAFREAFRQRRCLIPASGFYEWKTVAKAKQPYYFSLPGGAPMALAGLWETWRAPDGAMLRSCCILTTAANDTLAPIHDRMPLIIPAAAWSLWLDGPADEAQQLVIPFAAGTLQHWPVSRRVNRAATDDAALTEALEAFAAP